MREKGLAIITGANGGMGQIITSAIAREGYHVIMACNVKEDAKGLCREIAEETGNSHIEVREIDLASLSSVVSFADRILKEGLPVGLLINNAGILTTRTRQTEDGLETLVSVNYVGHYLLARKLIPLMTVGTRVINTVSCTYSIGKIGKNFFGKGTDGHFFRIPVYGNTKLALLLFTYELADRLKERGITVNASDPGIVSTRMITMNAWFDPLTDILFRPFIKTAAQGASTAIHLALSEKIAGVSGRCFANSKEKHVPERINHHPFQKILWETTEALLESKGIKI